MVRKDIHEEINGPGLKNSLQSLNKSNLIFFVTLPHSFTV